MHSPNHLIEIDLLRGGEGFPPTKTVLDTAYERAGYDLELDYRADAIPPLTPDRARWADELLRSNGLR